MKKMISSICGVMLASAACANSPPAVAPATAPTAVPTTVSSDGVYSYQLNAALGTITISDLLNKKKLDTDKICTQPVAATLSLDEANLIVACAGEPQLVLVNTASFQVVAKIALEYAPLSIALLKSEVAAKNGVLAILTQNATKTVLYFNIEQRKLVNSPDLPDAVAAAPNKVMVMGLLHDEHRKSKRYSLKVVEQIMRSAAPDVVLAEIPPNRFEAAAAQFKKDGKVSEARVALYPEFTEVAFPLQKTMGFVMVPVSSWNTAMSAYRDSAISRIQKDPARVKEWATLQGNLALSAMRIKQGGASDAPEWIHTDAYDAASAIDGEAWNHFDKELGTGGWDTINRAHYAHIARWLDQHKNQGKRVLITFGAAHKGWFLKQLRERKDIEILPMQPFLPKP
jgi:hypothetical protein